MAIDLGSSNEPGMNMTPMIDIVFNLVQFFMLTLDLSHKEMAVLDLPRANGGVEEKPRFDPNQPPRFVINLTQDGHVDFKGASWPLAVADPAAQAGTLENLRLALRTLAATASRDFATGASNAMVLIRGDRLAKWKYVQWIMQVCADPSIRIHRLHFAVEHPHKDK
jgi:biopolymer transport protein ExbD